MREVNVKKLFFTLVIVSIVIWFSLAIDGCAKTEFAPITSTGSVSAVPIKPIRLVAANTLPADNAVGIVMEKWAREFSEKTGDKYVVKFFHGGTLASDAQAYNILTNGIADISFFTPTQIAKPFPLLTSVSLPFSFTQFDIATRAFYYSIFKKGYLDKELADIKVLFLFHGSIQDVNTEYPADTLASMSGLTIIVPGGEFIPELIKHMGAIPIIGGPQDVQGILEKGAANGIAISSMGLKEFHWADYVKYHIEPLRLCGVIHVVGMSKATYNKMPDDVKQIIDNMDAEARYSLMVPTAWTKDYQEGIQALLEQGGKIINWSPEDMEKLNKLVAPFWNEWIKKQEAQGIPAKEVINGYYNSLRSLGIENPAIGYTPLN